MLCIPLIIYLLFPVAANATTLRYELSGVFEAHSPMYGGQSYTAQFQYDTEGDLITQFHPVSFSSSFLTFTDPDAFVRNGGDLHVIADDPNSTAMFTFHLVFREGFTFGAALPHEIEHGVAYLHEGNDLASHGHDPTLSALSAAPEPGSLGLVMVGLACIAYSRLRSTGQARL